MHKTVKVEASLACANCKNLEADIKQLCASNVDYLHIDIMDGRFVPNFALDFKVMEAARQITNIPLDCHLMIEEPERYIDKAAASGAAYIVIHFEATRHVQRALQQIRDTGAMPGIALNPATPLTSLDYILNDIDMITIMTVNPGFAGQELIPSMLKKIKDVNTMLENSGCENIEIQADGNVSFAHIPAMVAAGATMLVGGTSSVFHKGYTIGEAVSLVRKRVEGVNSIQ